MELQHPFVWIGILALFLQPTFADLTHGDNCNLNDTSNSCSPDEGLQCILGRCECTNPLSTKNNETLRSCIGLVGTNCEGPGSNVCHPDYAFCGQDSKSRTGYSCDCAQGYSPDFDRNCFRSKYAID
jgi:hypothetical protein